MAKTNPPDLPDLLDLFEPARWSRGSVQSVR
jgi:hypothetical protein